MRTEKRPAEETGSAPLQPWVETVIRSGGDGDEPADQNGRRCSRRRGHNAGSQANEGYMETRGKMLRGGQAGPRPERGVRKLPGREGCLRQVPGVQRSPARAAAQTGRGRTRPVQRTGMAEQPGGSLGQPHGDRGVPEDTGRGPRPRRSHGSQPGKRQPQGSEDEGSPPQGS